MRFLSYLTKTGKKEEERGLPGEVEREKRERMPKEVLLSSPPQKVLVCSADHYFFSF